MTDYQELLASHERLRAVCEIFIDGRPTDPPPPIMTPDSIAYRNWLMFEQARKALALIPDMEE